MLLESAVSNWKRPGPSTMPVPALPRVPAAGIEKADLVEVGQRSLAGRRVHQIVLHVLLTEVVVLHTDVSHLAM
jgi:hypothetical protein